MRIRIPLTLLLFLTICLKAQTGLNIEGYSGADSLIKQFISRWKINGAAVAVTKNGKLIYNKGFGYANETKSKPVQPNSLFRIASVSKPITSIAIMKLLEEGKLSLSDTVFGKNKILDQSYYLTSISDKRIYSITIQNLLEHTAGWDRSVPCDGYNHSDPMFFPLHVTSVLGEPNPVGDSTLIKFSLLKGLNNKPGTNYAYSNVGYLILGKIIEKLSGMKYGEYVTETIFKPLSIHDIHLGNNLKENKLEREVGYFSAERSLSCYGDGSLVDCQYGGFNVEAMNAHGGWIASAPDLTKLMLAVDGSETFPDIINSESIRTMNRGSSVNPYYAKGWSVNSSGNSWHTGSLDGAASFVCRTRDGYTWAFLFNSRGDNSDRFWNEFDRLPWKCIKTIHIIEDINLFAPEKNIFNIASKTLDARSAAISWTNGTGNGRIMVASENSSSVNFPADGVNYISNSSFAKGENLNDKTFVVYNGNDDQFILRDLDPGKTYYVYGFEYFKNTDTNNREVYKCAQKATLVIRPCRPEHPVISSAEINTNP